MRRRDASMLSTSCLLSVASNSATLLSERTVNDEDMVEGQEKMYREMHSVLTYMFTKNVGANIPLLASDGAHPGD